MKTCLAIFVAAISLATSVPAHGNGGKVIDPSLLRKVPELRQACEKILKHSESVRTTAQMLQASFDYQDCLIEIIEQMLDAYYPADNRDFIKRVRDIASDIRLLYWDIYCLRDQPCGTMFNVLSTGDQSAFIDDVVDTMANYIEAVIP